MSNISNNGKTIKQIADEIGVSKQAVQKRISREPLYTCIHPFVYTSNGTKYIAESGVLLILSAFGIDKPTTLSIDTSIDKTEDVYTLSIDKTENVYSDVYTDVHSTDSKIDSDIIKLLNDNITILQKQLDIKDKQIDDLNNRLEEVTAALTQEQALHAGTIQKQLTDGSTEKTSFFKRIFKK